MKFLRRASFHILALLLTGCVSASSGPSLPASTPVSIPPVEAPQAQRVTSWQIIPTNEHQKYSTLLTTVITQVNGPTAQRDSVVTQALFSISLQRNADSVLFSGSVIDFTVKGNSPDIEQPFPSVTVPILFTGRLANHNITTRTSGNVQAEDNCQSLNQTIFKNVQRNILILPFVLHTGQTWTDSISSVVCNGTLPASQTILRTLTVLGQSELDGSPVLILARNERTFSKGEGSQGQHQIFIESQGSTVGRLYLDQTSGQLLAANSTNKTSLSIRSSGRTESFTQNSTEILQRVR